MCKVNWTLCQGDVLLFVAKRIHFAAIFFGWTRANARRHGLGLRRHVSVEGLRLGGGTATFGQRFDFDDTNLAALRERQHVTRRDLGRSLRRFRSVYADVPITDLTGGKAAGLEEPRLPKPFIEAAFWKRLGYDLSFSAARTAKGLSGSILVVFSGRAE